MKTIQLTSPDSNHVQVSAMGVTEGARRAPWGSSGCILTGCTEVYPEY
jgi:hypothetical protein